MEATSLLFSDIDVALFLQHCEAHNVTFPQEWQPYLYGGDLTLGPGSIRLLNYHLSVFCSDPGFYSDITLENVVESSTVEETAAKALKRKAEGIVAEPANKLDQDAFANLVASTAMAVLTTTAEMRNDTTVDEKDRLPVEISEEKMVEVTTKALAPLTQSLVWTSSHREDARADIKHENVETRIKSGLEEAINDMIPDRVDSIHEMGCRDLVKSKAARDLLYRK